MKKLFYLLVSVIMVSCGTKTDKLKFSKFEIKDKNQKTGITVSKNEIIKIGEENIGKINRDGTLNDKEEKLLAKIIENNILQDKDRENLIKIDQNGTMNNGSGVLINGQKMENS